MKNKRTLIFKFFGDIKNFIKSTREEKENINLKEAKSKTVYPYNTNDAYKLYNLIIIKRLCALEFGLDGALII